MAPTNACVSMATMVTEGTVLTTTSAFENLATGMQYAETLKVPTITAVNPVFKAMEGHVLILMSVKRVLTIATQTPSVLIPGVHISVAV